MFSNQSILITGGTGSFGKIFVDLLLQQTTEFSSIVIFSRDEYKQQQLRREYPLSTFPNLKFVLGDVRDLAKVNSAFKKIDIVIHAAALKQVGTAEFNPSEFIKTNIYGTENVISAAISCQVQQVLLLSTDKAVNALGMYGATKLCAEKLFLQANLFNQTKFSVIRYGNIFGARGSVLNFLMANKSNDSIAITHEEMTRFGGTAQRLSKVILENLYLLEGGEILVPKMGCFKLTDLAWAINPDFTFQYTGVQPGERLHEQLIGESETYQKVETSEIYLLLSTFWKGNLQEYLLENEAMCLPNDFSLTTQNCTNILSDDELFSIISALKMRLEEI